MTDIPEDIMAKAQEIVPSVHWTSWATGNEIAEIIAAALLSERTAQEAEIARLTARVAELEKALSLIDALDPEEQIYGCSHDATRGLVIQMGRYARAALTPAEETADAG